MNTFIDNLMGNMITVAVAGAGIVIMVAIAWRAVINIKRNVRPEDK